MSTFTIDFFELAFLAESCVPPYTFPFAGKEWSVFPLNTNYIVSTDGDIISLPRKIMRKNGNPQTIKAKLLEPVTDKKGYLYVRISNLGSIKEYKVHQMVAITFLGHVRSGMEVVVDHINNIKNDNRVSNLQLLTTRDNSRKNPTIGKSGLLGAVFSKDKQKWTSRIMVEGKTVHLGYFDTKEEANLYYENALNCVLENRPQDVAIKKRIPSSSLKCVRKVKSGRFRASFVLAGIFYNVGTYDTEEEAYSEYLKFYNNLTNE